MRAADTDEKVSGKPKPKSLEALAKEGRAEELLERLEAGEDAELARLFERAVTDFRTIRRRSGHAEILRSCIERGLDLGARPDWSRQTVVSLAAQYGRLEIVERMIRQGLPDDPFSRASVGDVHFIRQLGEDLSSRHDVNGFNLLFSCAGSALGKHDPQLRRQLTELCALLLARGVDPNHTVESNMPLSATLFCCWFGGNEDVLRQLLQVTTPSIEDALHCIEFCLEPHQRSGGPHDLLAAVFLAAGYDINALRPSQGRTLLHGAANRGTLLAVDWLLANGADCNARDTSGGTPLHAAAKRNTSTGVVERLLHAGANIRVEDDAGRIPLDVAQENGRTKVASLLSSHRTESSHDERPLE